MKPIILFCCFFVMGLDYDELIDYSQPQPLVECTTDADCMDKNPNLYIDEE